MNKHVKDFFKATGVFLSITGYSISGALAQDKVSIMPDTNAERSKVGGGGSGEEVIFVLEDLKIKETYAKIRRFFASNPGLVDEFLEVDVPTLIKTIDDMTVRVVDKELIDKNGVSRTALNFPSELLVEYNLEGLRFLADKPEVLFVLSFHELLGLMGVEESHPENELLVQSYPISSRLVKYVQRVSNYDLIYKSEVSLPPIPDLTRQTIDYFSCIPHYSEKFARIDRKRKLRWFAGFFASAVPGAFIPFVGAPMAVGADLFLQIFASTTVIGFSGAFGFQAVFDKEDELREAAKLFQASLLSHAELKDFQYRGFLNKKLTETKKGFEGESEALDFLLKQYPIEEFEVTHQLKDRLARESYKRERKGFSPIGYDDFQAEILRLGKTDAFCPQKANGRRKPKTYNQVVRIVLKNIGDR